MNVQELLDAEDIYYRETGADFLVSCLNPEHDDANPSMRIDKILGVFNCFSCGYRGNIFNLYSVEQDSLSIKRESIRRKINELRSSLTGLNIPEGYTPYIGNWRNIRPETYAKFGAFKHHSPAFLGRIVFPIKDISGKVIAFMGRDETGSLDRKYLNEPRGVRLNPYPMNPIPIKGSVILVEGIFDLLNLYDKGLKNVTAILGLNNFKQEHLENFKIQGVTGIDLMLDTDENEAGQKAAEKLKTLCEENNMPSRVVKLRMGTDPGDLGQSDVDKLKERLYGKL